MILNITVEIVGRYVPVRIERRQLSPYRPPVLMLFFFFMNDVAGNIVSICCMFFQCLALGYSLSIDAFFNLIIDFIDRNTFEPFCNFFILHSCRCCRCSCFCLYLCCCTNPCFCWYCSYFGSFCFCQCFRFCGRSCFCLYLCCCANPGFCSRSCFCTNPCFRLYSSFFSRSGQFMRGIFSQEIISDSD